MSYSTSNPPALINPGLFNGRCQIWAYRSTDVATDVDAADYFSNGHALGMRVEDVVIVTDTDTNSVMTLHRVTAVTAGGAATVSTTGLTIT